MLRITGEPQIGTYAVLSILKLILNADLTLLLIFIFMDIPRIPIKI